LEPLEDQPVSANPAAIQGLEPAAVWQFFAELSAVPRPSKREEQIRAHVRKTAERLGLRFREDQVGNIAIDVPASPGHEPAPITVLQGHMDMVCEKNAGTQHDFDHDPIRLVLDKEAKTGDALIRADGTTLGADNGIGLALALAAATSPHVAHGPLEILCTIDEEMGMSGAKVLAPDFIKGRRMLNLDAEEDDALYIGCAGGCDTTLTWELKTTPVPQRSAACRITVAGLRGGHSGVDIHLNRSNAIKLLVQAVSALPPGKFRLGEIKGGSKRNVIPREAAALLVGPATAIKELTAVAQTLQETSIHAGEEACTIRVEKTAASGVPATLTAKDTQRLLTVLTALPHGVLAVVPEMPGLVQTSNSTSIVESNLADGKITITVGCLSRSSMASEIQATARQLAAIGELAGANVDSGNQYPGWQPNVNSPLLAICQRVYQQLFGQAPNVTAIHAGVECGIIGERMGDGQMDMISLGPHIAGAHSPDERVYVASVQKTWKYLTTLLAELARG
jgi:dipeptidase D